MKRSVAIILQGLVNHRWSPPDQPSWERSAVTQRCQCSANVLDHERHRAEAIAKMLEDEGLINE